MVAVDPKERFSDATQVRRALAFTEGYDAPELHLVITKRAITELYNNGAIDNPSFGNAQAWLEEELGGMNLRPVAILADKNAYGGPHCQDSQGPEIS
jgi:hypothetical protein